MNVRPCDLLGKYQNIFPYSSFNEIQEKSFNDIFESSNSMIIKAPTGSGKTVIFEMAALKVFLSCVNETIDYKIFYIAPLKSLCRERYISWAEKFKKFNPRGIEITGDSETNVDLSTYQLVYTTPEKMDCITRRLDFFKLECSHIRLVCIDEVHILNDEARGATFEVVITRLKKFVSNEARFIAVSATIGNIDDFTEWLTRPNMPCVSHQMADKNRMVNLKTIVYPYPRLNHQSLFQFDNILSHKLPDIIGDYSDGKPVLIFCITRKSTAQLASFLADSTKFNLNQNVLMQLTTISQKLSDGNLRKCVIQGIGFHHAGLNQEDRQILENTFMTGILPVLCSTSTLAMGVNLPAHLVIIKGTRNFNFTAEHLYTQNTLLQMIGRAGRPQFDISATAIILTSTEDEVEINKMLTVTSETIESHLNTCLTEHLNVEISLKTIEHIRDIEIWIKNTFLYIRSKKNPIHYGFVANIQPEMVRKNIHEIVMSQLNRLSLSQMVLYDKDTYEIVSTDVGHLMAKYFINIDTMEKIRNLPPSMTLESMVEFISNCVELSDINLRYSERGFMNGLNRHKGPNKLRFPIKGRIISTSAKINCLIQVILGSQTIKDSSLLQDSDRIFRIGNRILRCMHDLLCLLSSVSSNYLTILNCTLLKKCFQIKLWENTWFISQQLPGIGTVLASYLTDAGLNTMEKLAHADPRFIEQILHRNPPFGKKVIESALSFPRYELCVEQVGQLNNTNCDLFISVKNVIYEGHDNNFSNEYSKNCVILLVADEDNNVLCNQRIRNQQLSTDKIFEKTIHVVKASRGGTLHIDLINEYYVGLDIRTKFEPSYSQITSKSSNDKPINNNQETTSIHASCSNEILGCNYEDELSIIPIQSHNNTVSNAKVQTNPWTISRPGPSKPEVCTPFVKKPKIFSWKTCEIYKKGSSSLLTPQSVDLKLPTEDLRFQSRSIDIQINQSPPKKRCKNGDNIDKTKLSYGWGLQEDLNASVLSEVLLEDSFDDELSRVDFDEDFTNNQELKDCDQNNKTATLGDQFNNIDDIIAFNPPKDCHDGLPNFDLEANYYSPEIMFQNTYDCKTFVTTSMPKANDLLPSLPHQLKVQNELNNHLIRHDRRPIQLDDTVVDLDSTVTHSNHLNEINDDNCHFNDGAHELGFGDNYCNLEMVSRKEFFCEAHVTTSTPISKNFSSSLATDLMQIPVESNCCFNINAAFIPGDCWSDEDEDVKIDDNNCIITQVNNDRKFIEHEVNFDDVKDVAHNRRNDNCISGTLDDRHAVTSIYTADRISITTQSMTQKDHYRPINTNGTSIPSKTNFNCERDDILLSHVISTAEISKTSKYDYYNQGWDDLFDFITQREIIRISKQVSIADED